MAKPLLADGSETSHALALVYDAEGLVQLARGDLAAIRPPCVVQEFVDHGGCLFKVYVVGNVTNLTRRRSLPDLRRNGARGACPEPVRSRGRDRSGHPSGSYFSVCSHPFSLLAHIPHRSLFTLPPPSCCLSSAARGELRGLEFVERISCIGSSRRETVGPSSYGSVGSSMEGLEEEVRAPAEE